METVNIEQGPSERILIGGLGERNPFKARFVDLSLEWSRHPIIALICMSLRILDSKLFTLFTSRH
jgi:hypothetical protein